MKTRDEAFDSIRANIAQHGYHLYAVDGGPSPRWIYSIGLSPKLGFELVVPGAYFYSTAEVCKVIEDVIGMLNTQSGSIDNEFVYKSDEVFFFREVHGSWTSKLLIGAIDFYNLASLRAVQILPDLRFRTIDVPDLMHPWNELSVPVWQWLELPWSFSVSKRSMVVTNLDALRGKTITEVTRWEQDEWEIFSGSGPDVKEKEMRRIPLACLLAADRSLEAVINVKVGNGLWRSLDDLIWHEWHNKGG